MLCLWLHQQHRQRGVQDQGDPFKRLSDAREPMSHAIDEGENKFMASVASKQWKKEQVWPFFGCFDSQADTGRHQLYKNLLFFFFPLLDNNLT